MLADSPVVLDVAGEARPIIDDRIDHPPGYTLEVVRDLRNQPGGFGVASTKPEAAETRRRRGKLHDDATAVLLRF
ncbi:hypothetical protein SAMN05216215_1004154 [Saccharopolyspora shandongensis]|uniref:Uncharacterized protein n=1 Tax=Saccharopolyspora shandongensis TaxID=418495 RepID=A0A1H2V0G8_9PSEU|nr:hypothetical protein SAMN05216215_1004154 [Saccharopolyspora shandongensis]